jgi:hypothetical protein
MWRGGASAPAQCRVRASFRGGSSLRLLGLEHRGTVYVNRQVLSEVASAARTHASPRRVWTWSGFAIVLVLIRSVVWIAQRIDDLFWPEIAAQPVDRPVFIFANARSGTSLLHRLLDLDRGRFASFKLYQSIFCAVSLRRLVGFLGRMDRRVPGRPLQRLVAWINATFFSGWEGIHEMGIDKVEEDEAIFAVNLQSPAIALLMPWVDELPASRWFDEQPEAERERFLDIYEDALRRHLFASGGGRILLNKSALLAPRLRSIFGRFPDARFIYLIRHPYDSLPSFLSMFHDKWATHSPEIPRDSSEARALGRLAMDYLRYGLECRKFIPEGRLLVVRYDDLVADPHLVVTRIYDWLGLPVGQDFSARVKAFLSAQQSYVSSHHYALEEFGLSREGVFRELKEVFAEFGFER